MFEPYISRFMTSVLSANPLQATDTSDTAATAATAATPATVATSAISATEASKETPRVPSLRPKITVLSQQPSLGLTTTKEIRLTDPVDHTIPSGPVGPIGTNLPNLRIPVSPSLKQQQQQQHQHQQPKPISPPKPPILLKPKGKEIRICLPSITEIYASIYNEIHKRVIETLSEVLDKVGEDYKIDSDELKEKYLKELKVVLEKNQEEVKKIGVPTVRKPRTVLATDVRCMARTANGSQCTRRKQKDEAGNEYDFCGSHRTNQPNGQISDPPLVITEKKKRGRPPKKTVLVDGSVVENSEEAGVSEDQVESPYDDTTSMDFFEIKDGEYDYICNRNTKIVYEIPTDNQIADISELIRVGIWDQEQRMITYDN